VIVLKELKSFPCHRARGLYIRTPPIQLKIRRFNYGERKTVKKKKEKKGNVKKGRKIKD
jgi:hypothetical protein